MTAHGSQSGISVIKEVVWGVTPTGQFKGLNFTSEDLKYEIENKESNNVRPDRQTSDLIQTGAGAVGGIETEMQAGNLDYILPGALWSNSDWLAAPTVSGTTDFAVELSAGAGGIITFDAGVDLSNVETGHYFYLSGPTETANTGIFKVKGISGQDIQVTAPLAAELAVSGVVWKGDTIRNGTTATPFSMERANNDVSKFNVFSGMTTGVLEGNIESEEIITINVSFVGKEDAPASATASTPAATALSLNPIMSAAANVGGVYIDDTLLSACEVQKLDFSFDNKTEGKKAVSTLGNCRVTGKSIAVGGSLILYFEDHVQYLIYKAGTSFSMDATFFDYLGNMYVISWDKCKYDAAATNTTGKDDDVLFESTWKAMVGPNGYTMQITKIEA